MTYIQDTLYSHNFHNPITPSNGCDLGIILSHSNGKVSLQKEGVTKHQTKYSLRVTGPEKLGLESFSNKSVRKDFIRTVMSACNLLLEHAVFSDHEMTFSDPSFDDSVPPKVEDDKVTITLKNMISTDVFLSIQGNEEISEEEIISVVKMLNVLNNIGDDIRSHNMKKSLDKFNEAMGTDVDRLVIFSRLVNSLEIASCYDVNKRIDDWTGRVMEVIGPSLQIDKQTTVTSDMIEGWKKFYNRIKHPDQNEGRMSEFLTGQVNLPSQIHPLRVVVQKVILDRLRKITNSRKGQ